MGFFTRLFGGKSRTSAAPRVLPRAGAPGQRPTSNASVAGVAEIDAFVNWGEKIFVTSSNVAAAQYDRAQGTMLVWFDDGQHQSLYQYFQVSDAEAISFAVSPSKGEWIWDNLRIRGTRDGHRKSYVRVF